MSNPPAFQQPNTYTGRYWIYTGSGCDGSNDKCGVHTNSGVLNYWYYLLTTGGKGTNDLGNAFAVAGIGIDKAAAVAYATELALNPTSNYASCRSASIAAATTLYGACSKEVEAVTRAWYAVGVGANFAACTPQLSFATTTATVSENAGVNSCTASQVYNLPVVLNGPAPTGGNAVVTITAFGGTAIAGVDYDLPASPSVTFPANGTANQLLPVTIYDNAYLGTNKYIDLALSVTPSGSNAAAATVYDTLRLTISNDDRSPLGGGVEYHTAGSYTSTAIKSSPFASQYANAHGQYIYTAQELTTVGLRAGAPIDAVLFNVIGKGSKQPFTNYTMKIGTTTVTNFTSSFLTPSFTTVYSGNYTTAKGLNTISFSTPYTWDGVSNLVVEVCFGNASSGTGADTVTATASGSAAAVANSLTTSGCTITTLSGSNISYYRPVIRFMQNVPPTPVDTVIADARSWKVKSAQSAFFYSAPKGEIIAAVLTPTADLGCVTATITAQGKGFVPGVDGKLRSVRELSIKPATAVPAGTTYDAIIYFRNDDLDGNDPNSLSIIQTTAVTDAGITAANTVIATPTDITTGADWTGFRGNFNSFGRFFLTNGQLALGVSSPAAQASELWTGTNPFVIAPVLHWSLGNSERVSIRLTDITGKTVYATERTLDAGVHQLELAINAGIAPGAYVLQVVRPGGVFTRQMVKR